MMHGGARFGKAPSVWLDDLHEENITGIRLRVASSQSQSRRDQDSKVAWSGGRIYRICRQKAVEQQGSEWVADFVRSKTLTPMLVGL